jgi:hypothetical protein
VLLGFAGQVNYYLLWTQITLIIALMFILQINIRAICIIIDIEVLPWKMIAPGKEPQ